MAVRVLCYVMLAFGWYFNASRAQPCTAPEHTTDSSRRKSFAVGLALLFRLFQLHLLLKCYIILYIHSFSVF